MTRLEAEEIFFGAISSRFSPKPCGEANNDNANSGIYITMNKKT